MDANDAAALIAPAVARGETWADLGAGRGTFTEALARLVGPEGTVNAVERDASALAALQALARRSRDDTARIIVRRADFTEPLELPALDGALLANALHFVPESRQPAVLRAIARRLDAGGRIVIVEYDDRPPSRWVPHPISVTRLGQLAREAGLGAPQTIGRTESAFGGTMFASRLAPA